MGLFFLALILTVFCGFYLLPLILAVWLGMMAILVSGVYSIRELSRVVSLHELPGLIRRLVVAFRPISVLFRKA